MIRTGTQSLASNSCRLPDKAPNSNGPIAPRKSQTPGSAHASPSRSLSEVRGKWAHQAEESKFMAGSPEWGP